MAKRRKTTPRSTKTPGVLTPRQSVIAFYGGMFVLCLVVYHGISDNYLYNDDFLWLSYARHDMNVGNLFSFRVIGFFRPLINVTFYLIEKIAPGNLALHYQFNFVIHYFNSILVYHLLSRLLHNRAVPTATAAFFLVTSTHASAVVWISARTGLLSTLFLLLALIMVARPPAGTRNVLLAFLLYTLALAAKETAVIGVVLLGLMYLLRRSEGESWLDKRALSGFLVLTLTYLVIRYVNIGTFAQENWGMGTHMLRNVGGGVLFQFYPWSAAALLGVTTTIAESTHPFWPEITVLALLAVIIWLGVKTRQRREILFALAWTVIALVPMSPLKLRFFSTVARTHDRYYYLSSIGACLTIVLVLYALWQSRRMRGLCRTGAIALAAILLLGESINVDRREKHMAKVTENYRTMVSLVTRRLDESNGLSTCAIERVPMRYRYLEHALRLERPGWRVTEIKNREEATAHRPCLYVRFVRDGNAITTIAEPVQ